MGLQPSQVWAVCFAWPMRMWLHFERRFVMTVAVEGAMDGAVTR